MPVITISGIPQKSVEQGAELSKKIKETVAAVLMLALTPEDITVHIPADLGAGGDSRQYKFTVKIDALYRSKQRSERVVGIMVSRIARVLRREYRGNKQKIEFLPIGWCNPDEVRFR